MQIISYGDPSILYGYFYRETMMAGRHKCNDCYYDDECRRDCRYDDCGPFCPCDEDDCDIHCEYDD